jgi:hypothetical protein
VVGEPAPSLVIANQRPLARQLAHPMAPDRALPVVLQMRHPVGRLDQRRPDSASRVGDVHAVGRGAKLDSLLKWRRRGGRRANAFLYARDDTEAEPVNGADHALSGAIVADRLPRVLDPTVQRRRGHVPMAPNAVEQLLLRYHSVPTREQMRQYVEDLRLDVQALLSPAKLVQSGVELVLAKRVDRGFGRGFLHGILAGRASMRCGRRRERRHHTARWGAQDASVGHRRGLRLSGE